MTLLPKSKRLRFSVYVFHIFVGIGFYGIYKGADLSQLAIYLTAVAIPLVGYILGDTFRPSNLTDIDK